MSERMNQVVYWSAVGAFAACAVFLAVITFMIVMRPDSPPKLDLGADFSLQDYNGNTITQAAFEGQPSVLFFGFTNCPEICPLTVYELTNWFEEIGPEADEIAAFFVTVDPERDSPEILADYLKPQSDRVIGITGSVVDVEALQKGWRVYSKKVPLEGGDYTVDHTALLYLLDRNGDYWGHINYGASSEEAVRKLRDLVNS